MKVPWMSKKKLTEEASQVLAGYQDLVGYNVRLPIPVEDIVERYLGLRFGFLNFEEKHGMRGVLGATYVKARLICVNEKFLDEPSEGRMAFTCAHEVGHWVLHRRFVNEANRFGQSEDAIICRSVDSKEPIEWQADFFAACLLMPETEVREAFYRVCGTECLQLFNVKSSFRGSPLFFDASVESWPHIASAVREAGSFFNVSLQAIVIRLQELGLLVNLTDVRMNWNRSLSMD